MSTITGDPTQGLVLSTEAPDDGTTVKASDVNVPFEAIFNNFAFLGARGVLGSYSYAFDVETGPLLIDSFKATKYTDSANLKLDVPGCTPGETVLIHVTANALYTSKSGTFAHLRLATTHALGGPTQATGISPGARAMLMAAGPYPVALTAIAPVALAGTLRIFLQGKVLTAGDQIDLLSAATIHAVHFRKVG